MAAPLGGSYGSFPAEDPKTAATELQAALRSKVGQVVVVTLIVCIMEVAENFGTTTVDGTQLFFISNLKMDSDLDDGMKFARDRVYMIFVLLCAKLGDNGLGRCLTISYGAISFIVGFCLVSFATHPYVSRKVLYLLGAFLVMPFSQAAVSANLSNFGGDQFDLASNEGFGVFQERFFVWFVVASNSGTLLAQLLLAVYGIEESSTQYLADDWEEPGYLVSPRSYWTVFVGSALMFIVGILLFRCVGSLFFSEKSLEELPGSPIVVLTQFLVHAGSQRSFQGMALLFGKILGITIYLAQAILFWAPTLAPFLSVASAVGVIVSVGAVLIFCPNPAWVDNTESMKEATISTDDLKHFLRLLPLIMCAQISYGCLSVLMQTWYMRQLCQMDVRLSGGPDATQIFSGFFTIIGSSATILCAPIAIYYVNPLVARVCGYCGVHRFHDWTKFVVGIGFAVASVLLAAHFEMHRKAAPQLDVVSHCAPLDSSARALSAYWMVFPYFLMGISALYVEPTIMMISYRQVPKTMRSLTVVTNIFMRSASQSLVMALSLTMREYTPHDLDMGHLEYLYFVGIFMSLLLLLVFGTMWAFYQDGSVEGPEAVKGSSHAGEDGDGPETLQERQDDTTSAAA